MTKSPREVRYATEGGKGPACHAKLTELGGYRVAPQKLLADREPKQAE